jgi:hypothetical protein
MLAYSWGPRVLLTCCDGRILYHHALSCASKVMHDVCICVVVPLLHLHSLRVAVAVQQCSEQLDGGQLLITASRTSSAGVRMAGVLVFRWLGDLFEDELRMRFKAGRRRFWGNVWLSFVRSM